ncbi:hypothetical protein GUITHDRAFT_119098 [Guillardia theta CCMP2712]|uniref:Uncharacterized protein n=1 Tax=Guillardia theta (strain CCMP2712) TaxID=905079 RepID=L1IFG2_GUITC|nr:hypothetical protein GUITHDRAFT_119098 [Guillardia theta CCMP2712]EKX34787.1 hypothetical protein GUITHDRAFT_119098 [Guillardia theta CCMP2712]|eukprot:XP_005821767.1 hypothetical protein GUITHDRAFT_119098 [Guillardia theta CCMP2712]
MCRCGIAAVIPLTIVNMVFGLGLLIAGIVAATYKIPNTCSGSSYYYTGNNDGYQNGGYSNSDGYSSSYNSGYSSTGSSPSTSPQSYSYSYCEADRKSANDLLLAMALMGTLPAVFPLVFGVLGIVTSVYKNKIVAGMHLGCLILGIVLSIIGVLVLLVVASTTSAYCDYVEHASTTEFCKRYVGSLWAIVALNIVLAIYQVAFSIVMCGLCCQPDEWAGSRTIVAETVRPAVPIAQVAGTLPAGGEGGGYPQRELIGVTEYPVAEGAGAAYPGEVAVAYATAVEEGGEAGPRGEEGQTPMYP